GARNVSRAVSRTSLAAATPAERRTNGHGVAFAPRSRMFASMFIGSAKALLIAVAVFVPFERLAGLHPAQRTFRPGWATDLLTGIVNGLMIYAALLLALGGIDAVAAACVPQLR